MHDVGFCQVHRLLDTIALFLFVKAAVSYDPVQG